MSVLKMTFLGILIWKYNSYNKHNFILIIIAQLGPENATNTHVQLILYFSISIVDYTLGKYVSRV